MDSGTTDPTYVLPTPAGPPDPATWRMAYRKMQDMAAQGVDSASIVHYGDSMGIPRAKGVATVQQAPSGVSALPMKKLKPDLNGIMQDYRDRQMGDAIGMSQQAFQGITFGWGDEAVAQIRKWVGDPEWSAKRDQYLAEVAATQQAHPVQSAVAQMAGGAALAPLIPAAGGATLLGRVGAGASAGALGGALSGAGNAEPGQRMQGAETGAAIGTVLGGVLPIGTTIVRNILEKIPSRLLQQIPGIRTPGEQATALIAQSMAKDKMLTPQGIDDALQTVDQFEAQGKPVSLVDVLGENGRGRAKAAAALPGPAKQDMTTALVDRQADQGPRMVGDATNASQVGLQNVYKLEQQLIAEQKTKAAMLYGIANTKTVPSSTPVDVPGKPGLTIADIINVPQLEQAWARGDATASLDPSFAGLKPGPLMQTPDPSTWTKAQIVAHMQGKGPPVSVPDELPISGINYMKRYLSDIVAGKENDSKSFSKAEAYAFLQRLTPIVDAAKAAVPEYGMALNTFSTDAAHIDALNLGRTFMAKGGSTLPADLVQQHLAGMTQGEQEMFKTGAMSAVRDALEGGKGAAPDVAKKLSSPTTQKALAVLFGPNAQDFADRATTEATISRTTRNLPTAGSQTTPLREDMAELQQPIRIGTALVTGRPGGALSAGLGMVNDRMNTGWTNAVSEEMGKQFTLGLQNPNDLRAWLLSLKASLQRQPQGVMAPLLLGQQAGRVVN